METKQKIFVTIGTAAVVAAAIFGGATLYSGSAKTGAQSASYSSISSVASSNSSSSTLDTSSSATSTGSYKDGTYTKTISYYVPHGGSNSVKVTLTVSGGTITSVSADDTYTDRESGMYISSFESEVSSDAKGQSLASYSPSRIGGASLTTEAFAEAISGIRSDAAA